MVSVSTDERKINQIKYIFLQSSCLYRYQGARVLIRKSSLDMTLGLEYWYSAGNTRKSIFMEFQEQEKTRSKTTNER